MDLKRIWNILPENYHSSTFGRFYGLICYLCLNAYNNYKKRDEIAVFLSSGLSPMISLGFCSGNAPNYTDGIVVMSISSLFNVYTGLLTHASGTRPGRSVCDRHTRSSYTVEV